MAVPMPIVSVIVPVYNAVQTLQNTVQSLLAQTLSDFELLLVDDGSSDETAQICQALSVQDKRIRVLSQQNSGICAARNTALDAAQGRYIAFCDDDDLYAVDALQRMVDLAQCHNADMVRTGYRLLRQRREGSFTELAHPPSLAMQLRAGQSDGAAYARFVQGSGPQFVWNALYRREVLGSLRFSPRCRAGLEDFIFNAEFYTRLRCAVYEPAVTYCHYEYTTSTSTSKTQADVAARLQVLPLWLDGEYAAAQHWCTGKALQPVWNQRKAAVISFAMHQLRDAGQNPDFCRRAWRELRTAINLYPHSPLDFLRVEGQNKKQKATLFLFAAHLQGLYALLPNREDKL